MPRGEALTTYSLGWLANLSSRLFTSEQKHKPAALQRQKQKKLQRTYAKKEQENAGDVNMTIKALSVDS